MFLFKKDDIYVRISISGSLLPVESIYLSYLNKILKETKNVNSSNLPLKVGHMPSGADTGFKRGGC